MTIHQDEIDIEIECQNKIINKVILTKGNINLLIDDCVDNLEGLLDKREELGLDCMGIKTAIVEIRNARKQLSSAMRTLRAVQESVKSF